MPLQDAVVSVMLGPPGSRTIIQRITFGEFDDEKRVILEEVQAVPMGGEEGEATYTDLAEGPLQQALSSTILQVPHEEVPVVLEFGDVGVPVLYYVRSLIDAPAPGYLITEGTDPWEASIGPDSVPESEVLAPEYLASAVTAVIERQNLSLVKPRSRKPIWQAPPTRAPALLGADGTDVRAWWTKNPERRSILAYALGIYHLTDAG